ncbi:hypothetical protein GCM10009678_72330 [Actinomadura kijaniata]|uniref:DUF4280 domain-containing protein n=2 Tax=Actinomadura TaxID=1988 RepID=A0A7W3LYB5_ACTNM|nr:hypothetical protein [Actinomadura namibiensis]MBA8956583.1 hypothetical protein [Actinomadura namibiensis]
MPGFLAQQAATVLCGHGGRAAPVTAYRRVTCGGQPLVMLSTPYTIAGCPFPTASGGPCASGTWTAGSTRVRVMGGQPLVLQGGSGVCAPTGVPLTVTCSQVRVRGL